MIKKRAFNYTDDDLKTKSEQPNTFNRKTIKMASFFLNSYVQSIATGLCAPVGLKYNDVTQNRIAVCGRH